MIIEKYASEWDHITTFIRVSYDPGNDIGKLYEEKNYKMQLLFCGHISGIIKMLSNDVAIIFYNYFSCYNLSFDESDFLQTLLYLFDVNNGYDVCKLCFGGSKL